MEQNDVKVIPLPLNIDSQDSFSSPALCRWYVTRVDATTSNLLSFQLTMLLNDFLRLGKDIFRLSLTFLQLILVLARERIHHWIAGFPLMARCRRRRRRRRCWMEIQIGRVERGHVVVILVRFVIPSSVCRVDISTLRVHCKLLSMRYGCKKR